MTNAISQPETVNRLRAGVDAGFAMLAGMQLDLFTPLKAGPMTAEQLAAVLSAQDARRALQNIGAVLRPGGKIFIIGQILDDSRRFPLDAVGFNLTFINYFDAGESYTESEHRDWLSAAGFIDIERSLLPDGGSLLAARKSE